MGAVVKNTFSVFEMRITRMKSCRCARCQMRCGTGLKLYIQIPLAFSAPDDKGYALDSQVTR
jgi:hypothetical protein